MIDFSHLRVLEVDDDLACNELMCLMLRKFGIEADTAFNGVEAVEKIRTSQYDIVLMDVKMPVMDGIDATRIIRREISPTLIIVGVTAYAMPEDRDRCLEAGVTSVLLKPVELTALKTMLQQYSEARRLAG